MPYRASEPPPCTAGTLAPGGVRCGRRPQLRVARQAEDETILTCGISVRSLAKTSCRSRESNFAVTAMIATQVDDEGSPRTRRWQAPRLRSVRTAGRQQRQESENEAKPGNRTARAKVLLVSAPPRARRNAITSVEKPAPLTGARCSEKKKPPRTPRTPIRPSSGPERLAERPRCGPSGRARATGRWRGLVFGLSHVRGLARRYFRWRSDEVRAPGNGPGWSYRSRPTDAGGLRKKSDVRAGTDVPLQTVLRRQGSSSCRVDVVVFRPCSSEEGTPVARPVRPCSRRRSRRTLSRPAS